MAIIRIYTGADGKSHFQDIEPDFQEDDQSVGGKKWPLDATVVINEESGIIARRFDPERSNPWHYAPGRACAGHQKEAPESRYHSQARHPSGPLDKMPDVRGNDFR